MNIKKIFVEVLEEGYYGILKPDQITSKKAAIDFYQNQIKEYEKEINKSESNLYKNKMKRKINAKKQTIQRLQYELNNHEKDSAKQKQDTHKEDYLKESAAIKALDKEAIADMKEEIEELWDTCNGNEVKFKEAVKNKTDWPIDWREVYAWSKTILNKRGD